ncbi:MAG: hypothetical protein ABFD92_07495 [Planctomycetaceae bacterium]|nr:hypothetical protein [Planctomycetaceae bacterium]
MGDDGKVQAVEETLEKHGASPWAFGVRHAFVDGLTELLAAAKVGRMRLELHKSIQALWIVLKWPSGGRLNVRACYHVEDGLEVQSLELQPHCLICKLTSPMGDHRLVLEIPDARQEMIHFQVWLTPLENLNIPFWPSDLYPSDASGDPLASNGIVHAAQRGPAMAFLLATLSQPPSGTFLYFQDLSSLNDYCEQTHSVPETRVGGSWPELGYEPPAAPRKPLQGGKEISLSDGYLCTNMSQPADTGELAEMFFQMLGSIYLRLPRPGTEYRDWLGLARRTVADLETEHCLGELDGLKYLSAYVGTTNRRPESLVQLAVLLPLLEYQDWLGAPIPLTETLLRNLQSFYDPHVHCIMRYPQGAADGDAEHEDEKGQYEIDSWYLYHPLINLARLARRGLDEPRRLLTDSIEYAISTAHHFDYRWPIIFDGQTLDPLREAPSRELGQTDVPGLYAYLMLQMHELTGEQRYFDEAAESARHLHGLNFNTGYQFNNTAWGANATARLWRRTGREEYLHLCRMSVASIMQNAFIWSCRYGYAKHYITFFGLTPLREGAYIAPYEEFEVLAAFHEFVSLIGPDIDPWMHLLVSEYCKYTTFGPSSSYPSQLPEEAISQEPQNGRIIRDLTIPLEDLYQGWEKAGQVGQEVYGAGLAPGIVARSYHKVHGAPFMVFCQYPVKGIENGTDGQSCTISLFGDKRLRCLMRVIPTTERDVRNTTVQMLADGSMIHGRLKDRTHMEYQIPGGSKIRLSWDR